MSWDGQREKQGVPEGSLGVGLGDEEVHEGVHGEVHGEVRQGSRGGQDEVRFDQGEA